MLQLSGIVTTEQRVILFQKPYIDDTYFQQQLFHDSVDSFDVCKNSFNSLGLL